MAKDRNGRALRFLFWALPFALAVSVTPARAAEILQPGTYREVSAVTGHVLATGNEFVLANDSGQRRFSLNAIRPSDHNSGYIGGTLARGHGRQAWTSTQQYARCRLTFIPLARGRLSIAQDVDFGDCGFGYGVLASGTYVRTGATGKLGSWNGP